MLDRILPPWLPIRMGDTSLSQAPDGDESGINLFPAGLVKVTRNGVVKVCNLRSEELLETALRGKDLGALVHPQDSDAWRYFVQRTPRSQKLADPEIFRFINSAGDVRWLQITASMSDEYICMSLVDVSQTVRDDLTLRTSNRSLENLLNGLPAMVYRCRNDRRFTMEYVSAGCLGLTGKTAQELLNNSDYAELIHPDDRENVWMKVQEALQSRAVFELRFRLVGVDGLTRRVVERGQGFYSDSGGVLGMEGVVMLDVD
ncbi:MAG: PAS domain-containing protein [Candidatus Pseudomonas phytovorans]|uniref:histidine kinase n=1 Tax=Candidatus Pseudomonas phytovorans TaxID=3121377 RepID=A0AAJ5WPF0_9PSED|nr:PAS domain-containing protein [Pseudomonas sp.]WEK33313.1 MAG: PAS domain-containing protein [Pseudomonas sp.]